MAGPDPFQAVNLPPTSGAPPEVVELPSDILIGPDDLPPVLGRSFAPSKTTPARPRQIPASTGPASIRPPAPWPQKPAKRKSQVANNPDEERTDRGLRVVFKNSPPWLVSLVVHMAAMIMMALWVTVIHQKAEVQINATYSEEIGEQLQDDSIRLHAENPVDTKNPIYSPSALPDVADPLAAPLLSPISPNGHIAMSDVGAPTVGIALKGRETGRREVLLGAYGGNATTESAVRLALEWLVHVQRSDGLWSLKGPYTDGATSENIEAATAMALLAFQGHGDTHQAGEFKKNVANAWNSLLKLQNKEGFFFHGPEARQGLYTQAQCTIALCELYGMTGDSRFLEPAQHAINFAVKYQDAAGGWRYEPGNGSDMSVTGWFVMALKSAQMARLEVPQATLDNVMRFIDSVNDKETNRYKYMPDTSGPYRDNSSLALTAEALLCRQYLGWKKNDTRLLEGCNILVKNPINYRDQNVYYWYYAAQVMHHMEGDLWKQWNAVMRQEIPSHQVKTGKEKGSWNSDADLLGFAGGRLYVTCLSTYMLEVYYRHLPIYSNVYEMMDGK